MRKLLAALFLSLTALPASAAPVTWVEVRSPHFVVLTNSTEKEARHLAGQFERMRSVFHVLIPGASNDAEPPIVVLGLKDHKSFQSLEPSAYLAKGALDLAGLFLRTQDKNYVLVRLDERGEHPFTTIYHEYTHYIVRKADFLPLWLNEGLAQFYQNTEIEDKTVLLGQPSPDQILYLREQRLIPLATLLQVDHNSPYYHEDEKGSVFYAESWALTHYLMILDKKNNTHVLQDYLKALVHHEDSVTAAQHAFGDLKKLQQALDSYVSGASFSSFRMNSGVMVDESKYQARTVTGFEADAVRADVLVGTNRIADAQTLLDSVLRDDPKSAPAHESMALLKMRQGDMADARKWYEEAVQLGSQSYLAQYHYAVLSLQSGDHVNDDTIETSLHKSIDLNPEFAPAYDTLAVYLGSRHRNFKEAHDLSVKAVALEPHNIAYRMNAATVLTENNDFAGASNVLQAALSFAQTPGERSSLQNRIDGIKKFQAARDQSPTLTRVDPKTSGETDPRFVYPAQATASATSVTVSADGKTATLDTEDTAEPAYPTEPSKGAHHTVKGVIHNVKCSFPAQLALTLDQAGKPISLYALNYFKIPFTTANYAPSSEFDPCKGIEGMKASIVFAEITDKTMAGQVLSIELSH